MEKIIPYISVSIAFSALIFTIFTTRRNTKITYTRQLELRLEALEHQLEKAKERIESLEQENVSLMRKLLLIPPAPQIPGGPHGQSGLLR